METLLYIGKVNLYWILLLACYQLLLRNHTFFKWNRYYLLGSLLIAFALPLFIYPANAPLIPLVYQIDPAALSITANNPAPAPFVSTLQLIWIVYSAGLLLFAFRFFRHISELARFLKAGETIELDDCTIILIDSNKTGSFSFFKWIVINRNDYDHHFDAILRHEMVHTQQMHSLDILLIEVLKIVFWFNPFLLLYKRSMQEIHEFLADAEAPNRDHYARFLVAYALNAPITSLTNHFFKASQIKSRIKMIYRNRTSKWMLGTYGVALTIIALTALVVAGCERNENVKSEVEMAGKTQDKLDKALTGQKIYSVVEVQPEFPGGNGAMFEFIGRNIRYPKKAYQANVHGRIFLQFVVTKDGDVRDIVVLKGIGSGCDEEAVRVLALSPKWKPGLQNGKPVNAQFNLPINFELEEAEDKNTSSNRNTETERSFTAEPLAVIRQTAQHFNGKLASTKSYVSQIADTVPESSQKNRYFSNYKFSTANIGSPKSGELAYPRAGYTVTLKGYNGSEAQPLIIIDGVKQEKLGAAGYEHLKSDEIEAIHILKNQSAKDIYGAEGDGGVILITTKP